MQFEENLDTVIIQLWRVLNAGYEWCEAALTRAHHRVWTRCVEWAKNWRRKPYDMWNSIHWKYV